MATIPGSMLLCGSSPHARRGALWDAYRRHFGKDGGPLVWKAATREMNPSVPQSVVDKAMDRDRASALAEFGAEFRTDIEGFVSLEAVEACVSTGVRERGFISGQTYLAFVDPSGGVNDAMTLAVAHAEGDRVILDAVRERKPPFSPEGVMAEFASVARSYGLTAMTGDRYGGEWPREQARRNGVEYLIAEKPRSDLYRDMLPMLTSGAADLLDNPTLVNQIVGLERRVARGGRESIDHAPGAHDDLANAVAGALTLAHRPYRPPVAASGVYVWG